jgi:hypothetical protein
MTDNDIHVLQGESGSWLVTDARWVPANTIRAFRVKSHATAFASAVAFSRGSDSELIVHGPDGSQTRHERASLTYPTELE